MNFDVVSQLEALPKAEHAARLKEMRERGDFGHHRLFVGKTEDKDALVALRDAKGRVRLRLRVTAAGAASIEFLDAAGKVIRTESPG